MKFNITKKQIEGFIVVIILFIINGIIMYNYPSEPDKWYMDLKKSPLNPPGYVFGIAWTILYILIIISYTIAFGNLDYIYWILPIIHLLLNFSYSPVFFYYKKILGAAILTTLILIFAIITMYIFSFKSYLSVFLLIPYIIWLLFANYLSWSVYFLNKNK
jgi:tryptophan-rich sensory protein